MARIAIGGCSVTNGCGVTATYAKLLEDQYGHEILHCHTGVGSNYAMVRKVTTLIREGRLKSGDYVIMQFTDLMRKEFYWRRLGENVPDRDRYGDARVTKFKMDSYTFTQDKEESKLHKLLQDYCIDDKFDKENFLNLIYTFESLLIQKEINLLVLESGYYTGWIGEDMIPFNNTPLFQKYNIDEYFKKYPLDPVYGDFFHISKEGHVVLAKAISAYII